FPAGYTYRVSTRVELSGSLTLPPEKDRPARPLAVTGTSAIDYDEVVLAQDGGGQAQKTARLYRRFDLQRKVGDQDQQSTIRPEVRRLVLLRKGHTEVPFSPDGPLLWAEIDLVRTDVFTPALAGLLPAQPVGPGGRWAAATLPSKELTDLARLAAGSVACKFEQVTNPGNRRHARVSFSGTVRGLGEDGPNQQTLEGYFLFDLVSNHLSYLYV